MTGEQIHNILVNATDFIFKDGKIESCSTNIDLLAHNLYIEVNEHETDLLKEFVEWLKAKYEKDRKSWYEIAQEKEQAEDEWEKSKAPVYFGRSYGFDRCATDLDQDLENFLEERKC